MKHSSAFFLAVGALVASVPTAVHAHFQLLQPASWLIEDALGNPQKSGPCGGTNTDWGKPSNIITRLKGGQKLHIKVQEIVFHPGHYRVALAVNSRTELPLDPEVTTKETDQGTRSVSAAIQNPPQIPVLADGLWPHTAQVGAPFETDVQLPNINCRKCTLQVVEFMAEHPVNNPGNFTYHHCADLQITADPTKPMDKGWPLETLPRILDIDWRLQTTPSWLAVCTERNFRYIIDDRDGRMWCAGDEPLAERRRALTAG